MQIGDENVHRVRASDGRSVRRGQLLSRRSPSTKTGGSDDQTSCRASATTSSGTRRTSSTSKYRQLFRLKRARRGRCGRYARIELADRSRRSQTLRRRSKRQLPDGRASIDSTTSLAERPRQRADFLVHVIEGDRFLAVSRIAGGQRIRWNDVDSLQGRSRRLPVGRQRSLRPLLRRLSSRSDHRNIWTDTGIERFRRRQDLRRSDARRRSSSAAS